MIKTNRCIKLLASIKRSIVFVAAVCLALTLSACGNQADDYDLRIVNNTGNHIKWICFSSPSTSTWTGEFYDHTIVSTETVDIKFSDFNPRVAEGNHHIGVYFLNGKMLEIYGVRRDGIPIEKGMTIEFGKDENSGFICIVTKSDGECYDYSVHYNQFPTVNR